MTLGIYEQAHVAIVEVKGVRYVRVVTYSNQKTGSTFRILKSFGRIEDPENHLKAELFMATYNIFKEVLKNYPTPNTSPFQDACYAVFGFTLGKELIEEMLS